MRFMLLALSLWAGATVHAEIDTATAPPAAPVDWAEATGPLPGPQRIIGPFGGGCIAGAERLPEEGVGYQAVDLERNRHYGHRSLIDYIEQLGDRKSVV